MAAQNPQKIRLLVRASIPHRPPDEGYLFLTVASRQRKPETLISLLNSGDVFMPFESDGLTKLVSRRHLQWVLAEPSIERQLLLPTVQGITREELVRVRLQDGAEASGLMAMEIPDEKSRASDFMNARVDFFVLNTAHGLMFVNKRCVVEMVVFETPPLRVMKAIHEAA